MTDAEDRLDMTMEAIFGALGELGGSMTVADFDESTDVSMSFQTEPQSKEEIIKKFDTVIELFEMGAKAFKDVRDEMIQSDG